jgi:hypothetical protein
LILIAPKIHITALHHPGYRTYWQQYGVNFVAHLDVLCSVRAMAQAVGRRPFTAQALVRSQTSPHGICGGQSGTGTVFLRVLRFSPVSIVPPMLYTSIYVVILSSEGRAGEEWEPSKKAVLFLSQGTLS